MKKKCKKLAYVGKKQYLCNSKGFMTMKSTRFIFHIDHVAVVILSFMLWWGLLLCVYNISFLNPVGRALDNFSMSDMFFEIENNKGKADTCQLITLVDMTELHTRADIGKLLDEVNSIHPFCMGVDLIFEGEKDDQFGNIVLESEVVKLSDNTFFAQKLTEYDPTQNSFTASVRSYFTSFLPIQEAYTNFTDNLEHTNIRALTLRQNLHGESVLSFPAALANYIDPEFVGQKQNDLTINYKHTIFPSLRYDEVLAHPDMIANHIVLIGTLNEEQDMHLTPLGKMSGMMIHAYSLQTLLEHNEIHHLPWVADFLICFIICWLLQITLTALSRLNAKYKNNGVIFFLNKSNLLTGTVWVLWLILFNYALYICFSRHHIILDATMLFAMMAILLEGREIYSAIINALAKKYHWQFIENSLFLES